MATDALQPSLSAPASIILIASSRVLMPPEALICILLPTVRFMSLTASAVAPPVLKPVDVFTKSASAASAARHAFMI